MIRISQLPLIQNPGQFYATEHILLVDVLLVGDAPRQMREYIKNTHGGFIYDKKTYIPITLTGTPESLLANAGKPIVFKFDRGFENHYHFDGNLNALLWHKKLYNISSIVNQPSVQFEREEDFIIERYITGYREYTEPETEEKLLSIPVQSPAIGLKAMRGLKPVRKDSGA
ncbi:hypothetical protein J2Y45_005372 [Dyadobacter sp. BE34]|uniref:Uncharacterized protein n=1 Tax=Dyadobacter fermentans TaxID=94254 RepID=A0ABU1R4F3_9BACT|nr:MULTISPECIES: hypothetical protein [Dyadobacter]MDR6808279.1 hypothetical protein [Dyadobacter fermentans]MDR7045905.1 hypothetical protein [Dyadobacter sp. BE242]MDR7200218.1 hypothetical protein [Dyadobacter sp. BE34]MDR7218178.1 hypothetical protein [Dyadobacter sp. BE31]MDR7266109.1 hypothetical protein [Dyadobacter sp. BE32]